MAELAEDTEVKVATDGSEHTPHKMHYSYLAKLLKTLWNPSTRLWAVRAREPI
jgi:hypothetical protein